MKYTYYAIFSKADEGGYNVTFPDIFGGVTCGDNLEDAKAMAEDLLRLMLTTAKAQCSAPKDKVTISKLASKKDKVIKIEINI